MNKILCFLFALMLCVSVAVAETVPSKTTADFTEVKEVVAENLPVDAEIVFNVVVEDEAVATVTTTEIAKLAEAADVESYFGTVTDAAGNEVSLKEMLGAETINVFEFVPVAVESYEEEYGKIAVTMSFSTPYAKDEIVIVLVGMVENDEAGNQIVTWTAFEGLVVEEGSVKVEFDEQTMLNIQNGVALVAIVSK